MNEVISPNLDKAHVSGCAVKSYSPGDYYEENGKQIQVIACKSCGKSIPKRDTWTTECYPCAVGMQPLRERNIIQEFNDSQYELWEMLRSDADSGL